MRTEILELLNTGKKFHAKLIANYSEVLPENIIDGGNQTISQDIPNKTNVILNILNMAEREEKYSRIDNIDEAINLFENEDIQESIDKAIENKNLIGYSLFKNEKLSTNEIIDNAKFGIKTGVRSINMLIRAGELTKNKERF
jgi:hypothetical protein